MTSDKRSTVKMFPITVPILGPWSVCPVSCHPRSIVSVTRLDPRSLSGPIFPARRLDELADWWKAQASRSRVAPARPKGEELSLDHRRQRAHRPDVILRTCGGAPGSSRIPTSWRRHGASFSRWAGERSSPTRWGLERRSKRGSLSRSASCGGMARRVLILTPAGLVWQWFRELKEKFNLVFGMQRSEYDWERTDLLIASLDTAKR